MIYPILRKAFFKMPPEKAHYFAMNRLKNICSLPGGRALVKGICAHHEENLKTRVFGLDFRNPVGLGAGFDKNALYLRELEALGFGSVEIGTVTPKGQAGNPQPRLFRLPKDQALINRMGFNNDGAEAIRMRLENWRTHQDLQNGFIIGGNIGKNKVTDNQDAYKDYVLCYQALYEVVDYFTVNVSSPNTPGLRALQEKDSLFKIFSEIQQINQGKNVPKPVLLKIAPDLNQEQLEDILELAKAIELSGIVATNTTVQRTGLLTAEEQIETIGAGGLSGRPVKQRATEVMDFLVQNLPETIPVIASGGIFTPEDARQRLAGGARLVQVWTGFIYEGPSIAGKICKHLE
ncbi:dihydroorotate oxidase A [Arachidicoccus rhizosphaerae]|uniref:Dihydroorotate dehydrogenase (quinone) n=1 Tax=Arachidicoccus rhizosphaerae TaxID=551991 RepID=A0A1H4BBK4_9BACT|nr:quinone-dependent dihydroorotate dehydrogenase [Arachidicoccus rhizosphaerae]SEA45212.1 dihydroorotate oxidase A [Arachidicoccus rhizosphaerae]